MVLASPVHALLSHSCHGCVGVQADIGAAVPPQMLEQLFFGAVERGESGDDDGSSFKA